MIVVGLTGGIASGKTTVSNLFAEMGVSIIDTDVISRQLLETGAAAFEQVKMRYGDSMLNPDDTIDRKLLREKVFSNKNEKKWLESILHPLIYQQCIDLIQQKSDEEYSIVVVPLLFETKFTSLVDRVCAIDCPQNLQIDRLILRDGIDRKLAKQIIAQQLDNDRRLALAQDIINNNDQPGELKPQVVRLDKFYRSLSRK